MICLTWRRIGDEIVPAWLTEADEPWLRDVLEALSAADGLSQRGIVERIRQAPRQVAPSRKVNMVCHTLLKAMARLDPPVPPRQVRAWVFGRAHLARRDGHLDRTAILREASTQLGVDAEQALFASVPAERRLTVTTPLPSPPELRARVNLALAQGLVARSIRVQIDLDASVRDIVRVVHLQRLICVATRRAGGSCRLDISGVTTLFRRTTLYGRSLASLVPRLAWCGRFALRARCLLAGEEQTLMLGPTDGLKPARAPKRYDSKLEARFASDFARAAPDWTLIREPEAMAVGEHLVFPDFGVERNGQRWLIEIVGFWTPEYLEGKLQRLRDTGVLLCIDQRLACGAHEVADLPVVWFRRRLDPQAVLDALSRIEPARPDCATAEPRPRPILPPQTEALELRDYFIDFAGRKPPEHPIHQRLGRVRVGDVVHLREQHGRGALATDDGVIALLSAGASATWLPRAAQIHAVRIVSLAPRHRSQSGAAFRHHLEVDRWLVPLVAIERLCG